jgi:hypothetical protein
MITDFLVIRHSGFRSWTGEWKQNIHIVKGEAQDSTLCGFVTTGWDGRPFLPDDSRASDVLCGRCRKRIRTYERYAKMRDAGQDRRPALVLLAIEKMIDGKEKNESDT